MHCTGFPGKIKVLVAGSSERIVSPWGGVVTGVPMKQTMMTPFAAMCALGFFLFLFGCAPDDGVPAAESTGPGVSSGVPEGDRVRALEARLEALRAEVRSRDEALRGELEAIRKSLDEVRDLLRNPAKPGGPAEGAPRADGQESDSQREQDRLDDELDTKAKTFVNESLDRLLEITKKLLDRMSGELDEMDKTPENDGAAPAEPKGDAI
jgi:Skp family chaperone for outer membrane proteins